MKSPVRLLAAVATLAVVLGPAPAQAAPETMTMAIWSNYLPEDVIHDFEKAAGCKVEIPWYYGGNDELLAKLQGKDTGFDVVVPSDVILPALIGQGLLEPLDRAALANAGHIDPELAKRQADPDGKWSVPYTWGTVGVAWRTDKIKVAPDSWNVFADARLVDGNAFLLEDARDVVAAALLVRGHDVNSVEAKDLADAKETLLTWKKGLKGFTGETKNTLLQGEAWLIQGYNGDVAQAMHAQPGKYGFAVPKEGGILWIDNLVIPKGAPHKALATKFIDFVLDPKNAARISNGIRYAVANKDVGPLLDPVVRDDPVIYAPADVRKRLHQYKELGADLKKISDLWTEVRAGG